MDILRISFFLSYLLIQAIEHWLRRLNLRHMRLHGMTVPEGFEGYVDEGLLRKTHAYTIDRARLSMVESLFGSAVLLIFLFGGILERYNSWIQSLGMSFVLQGIAFFLLLSLGSSLLSMPFDLYGTFVIERRYGFSTMTLRLWLSDLLKSTLLSTVLSGIVLGAGFWIVSASPGLWWLFVWGFFFLFSLFVMYISPYVIEPLFHKFTPLSGTDLEERIKGIMEKAGITVSRVFKVDASKRSRHTNAYFTGVGRAKRIVLYDTLLEKMDEAEILAVLAHEAGHWKKRHILKMIFAVEAVSLVGSYIAFRLLETDILAGIFGLSDPTFFAKLVILGFIASIILFPLTPMVSFLSRRHEYEADRFALRVTGASDGLARALIKLSKDNLSNLHPHPLYARFYYSHPPVVERVRSLAAAGKK